MSVDPELTEAFARVEWLANVGQPESNARSLGAVEEILQKLEDDPDSFFEPPYTDLYEAMCVEDHKAAACLESTTPDPGVTAVARQAYLSAWERIPHAELCALVSDDVRTIMTLLVSGQPLRPFTVDRLRWYQKGRVPWGYIGIYPNGEWVIL